MRSSAFAKPGTRIAFLGILVLSLIMLSNPTNARAGSIQACLSQLQACVAECGLTTRPTPERGDPPTLCVSSCYSAYGQCVKANGL
jgi:hypothetical protein